MGRAKRNPSLAVAGNGMIIKYDQAGNVVWTTSPSLPWARWFFVTAITLDPENNLYFTASAYGTGPSHLVTGKYSSVGESLWVAGSMGDTVDIANPTAIALDSKRNVYAAGNNGLIIKYNNRGKEIWARKYRGPEDDADYLSDFAVTKTGTAYLLFLSSKKDMAIRPS